MHYGIKIAANSLVFVEAKNQDKTFAVQFAPYNGTKAALQCVIPFGDPTHYIYSVAVGSSQVLTKDPYVYYAGEVVSKLSRWVLIRMVTTATFIAILINRDNASIQSYVNSGKPISCDQFSHRKHDIFSFYLHQEYYVMAVEPFGKGLPSV